MLEEDEEGNSPLSHGRSHGHGTNREHSRDHGRDHSRSSQPKSGLNLKEREAARLKELEIQKKERAARHAEKGTKKKKKDREHHVKDKNKYNIAAAGEILGESMKSATHKGGVTTNFNYDTPDETNGSSSNGI